MMASLRVVPGLLFSSSVTYQMLLRFSQRQTAKQTKTQRIPRIRTRSRHEIAFCGKERGGGLRSVGSYIYDHRSINTFQ